MTKLNYENATMKTLVSVLGSTFCGDSWINESVNSVLAQQGVAFELLIVDVGSADRTAAINEAYQDSNIKLFDRGARFSLYSDMNWFAAQAGGSVLKPWAHVDVMLPLCLFNAVWFREQHPSVTAFYCNIAFSDETGKLRQEEDQPPAVLNQKTANWYTLFLSSSFVALLNIMRFASRLQLLLRNFEYQSNWVVDNTHVRWDTFTSACKMLEAVAPGFFGYQLLYRVQAK